MYFAKKVKCKKNLYNIASTQYHYLWMISSKNWLKRMANITEKAIVTITSSTLLFTELVFIFVSISEQET